MVLTKYISDLSETLMLYNCKQNHIYIHIYVMNFRKLRFRCRFKGRFHSWHGNQAIRIAGQTHVFHAKTFSDNIAQSLFISSEE